MIDFERYWRDCVDQDSDALRNWFLPDARIIWPCTAEEFTVEEFILANCEYPGRWTGEILQITPIPSGAITEVHIISADGASGCYAVSFFTLRDGKIAALTEYFGDDVPPPAWRTRLLHG